MRVRRIPPPDPPERYFLALLADPSASPPAGAGAPFWERVVDLAAAHRLAEFLHARRADAVRATWPDAARETLRAAYVETALRNARFRAELVRVASTLRGRGLAPILLKGGALTLTVYGDPAERPYGDLDLLIRREELDTAAAAMVQLGYVVDASHQPQAFYRAHHYHLIFRHAERPWLCFELHWDLSLPAMDVAFDAEGLRRRAEAIALDDQELLVPAPADTLLHVALHSALNGFSYLGQIRDVAAIAGSPAVQLDPALLWRRAQAGRLATPLAVSLSLARLFGDRAPAQLLARRPRPRRGGLLDRLLRPETIVRQRLHSSAAGSEVAALLRRDHWTGRLAHLRRMVRPSAADLSMNGHPAGAAAGWALWAEGRYGPGAPLRAAAWTLLSLGGWEVAHDGEAVAPARTEEAPRKKRAKNIS